MKIKGHQDFKCEYHSGGFVYKFGEYFSEDEAKKVYDIISCQDPNSIKASDLEAATLEKKWQVPVKEWGMEQVLEFLSFTPLANHTKEFSEHCMTGIDFIEIHVWDLTYLGLKTKEEKFLCMQFVSFFRQAKESQEIFPIERFNVDVDVRILVRGNNNPEEDVICLMGDELLKTVVIQNEEEFKTEVFSYIDLLKKKCTYFSMNWQEKWVANVMQKYSNQSPNDFDDAVLEFEATYGERIQITDITKRYTEQCDFVKKIVKQYVKKLSPGDILEVSRSLDHMGTIDSVHMTGLGIHRSHYTIQELHDLLHLFPLEDAKTNVEVSQEANIFHSHAINFKLSRFYNLQKRCGYTYFFAEAERTLGGLNFLNVYQQFIEKIFSESENEDFNTTNITVDKNTEFTFQYANKLQFWDANYSELASLVILNQVTGVSIVNEVPPLVGIYLKQKKDILNPKEMSDLINELSSIGVCKTTTMKPGDYLLCSPFHYRCIYSPHEKFNPTLLEEPCIVLGCYVDIKEITDYLKKDLEGPDWYKISEGICCGDPEDESDDDILILRKN